MAAADKAPGPASPPRDDDDDRSASDDDAGTHPSPDPDAAPEVPQKSGSGAVVAALSDHAESQPPLTPPTSITPQRGPAPHPEIVRHAAAAFNARVTKVVQKKRPPG